MTALGYGDPDHLLDMARRLEGVAATIDDSARRMRGQVASLRWESPAARAFRECSARHCRAVYGSAEAVRAAAVEVRAVAGRLRAELALIRRAEAEAAQLLHQGERQVRSGVRHVLGGVQHLVQAGSPAGHRPWPTRIPEHGSVEWLAVRRATESGVAAV